MPLLNTHLVSVAQLRRTDLDRIFEFSEDVTTALAAMQMNHGK